MLHIGCHLSSTAGFAAMGRTALSIGADTFQFFTRNPRGSKAKAIDPKDAQALMELMAEHHFAPLIAHAPYTLNPCSASDDTRQFALETMEDDLKRMEFLPGQYYNFHPGSHVGQGMETGITLIAETLNDILKPDMTTTVLLENAAGAKTLPVKTNKPLSKELLFAAMEELAGFAVSAPVTVGTVLLKDFMEPGVDLVACKTVH